MDDITKDLASLFIKGYTKGIGVYNHDFWHVMFENDSTTIDSQLISLHESLHSELNHCTAYGLVLVCYNFLRKETKDALYDSYLQTLMKKCTLVHEIYAVYMSSSILSPIGSGAAEHRKLLESYPDYLQYYRRGTKMLKGIKGKYLSQTCLKSAIRISLQSKSFTEKIIDSLDAFDLSQFPESDFPEARLKVIQNAIDQGVWTEIIEKYCNSKEDGSYLKLVMRSENEPEAFNELIDKKYDLDSSHLFEFIYAELVEVLKKAGRDSLVFNEHLDYIDALFEETNKIFPYSEAKYSVLKRNEIPENYDNFLLLNHQYEIVYTSPAPIKTTIIALRNYPLEKWGDLAVGVNEDQHFFLVARTGKGILEQYFLSEKDRNKLLALEKEVLVFLRVSEVVNGEREVFLFLLESIEDIIALKRLKKGAVCFNITLSCFAIPALKNYWLPGFEEQTLCSVLIDLSLHRELDNLAQQFDQIDYQFSTIEVGDKQFSTFLFYVNEKERKMLLLAPCSIITAKSIKYYLENKSGKEVFRQNGEFLVELSWQIRMVLGHLFREEHYFKFR